MIGLNVKVDLRGVAAFRAKSQDTNNMALAHMSQDIEIGVKTGGRTPFKKGPLRDQTYHEKVRDNHFQVVVPVEYAEVQEKGRRGNSKAFRNYTTAGTGKGFFEEASGGVVKNAEQYFEVAAAAHGIGD